MSMNIELHGENVIKYTCSVGDKLKICQPVFYPPPSTNKDNEEDLEYELGGFRILYPDVGKFEGFAKGSNMCIIYKHLLPDRQIIQYSSRVLGEHIFYIILDAVVVHDHSSVQQGGPAYATYYSRIPEEKTEK